MPQMAPMNWTWIFLFTLFQLLFLLMIIYFLTNNKFYSNFYKPEKMIIKMKW